MNSIVSINLFQFSLIYLLLLLVLGIMKFCHINQTKLLFVASLRMTVQLILSGLVLMAIFKNPHPIFTVLYVLAMLIFSIHRIYVKCPDLNKRFKVVVFCSLGLTGVFILSYFICIVVGMNLFNPQYTIPISGMLFGNALTGINLGISTFYDDIKNSTELKIEDYEARSIDKKIIESINRLFSPIL